MSRSEKQPPEELKEELLRALKRPKSSSAVDQVGTKEEQTRAKELTKTALKIKAARKAAELKEAVLEAARKAARKAAELQEAVLEADAMVETPPPAGGSFRFFGIVFI